MCVEMKKSDVCTWCACPFDAVDEWQNSKAFQKTVELIEREVTGSSGVHDLDEAGMACSFTNFCSLEEERVRMAKLENDLINEREEKRKVDLSQYIDSLMD